MSRMKDELIRQQEIGQTFRRVSDAEQAARDDRAELTGVLSGCYDAVRSLRHSAELDQDVVITLRAMTRDGDTFFRAKFEPLGVIFHGYDYGFEQTAAVGDGLSDSFDRAIEDFDASVSYTRWLRQING